MAVGTWVGVREAGGIPILEVVGRLTLSDGTAALRGQVLAVIEQGSANLLVNLAGVPYLDSAGMGELVATHKAMLGRGGRMKLLSPSQRVRDLLRASRLDRVLESFHDEAEALRSFAV